MSGAQPSSERTLGYKLGENCPISGGCQRIGSASQVSGTGLQSSGRGLRAEHYNVVNVMGTMTCRPYPPVQHPSPTIRPTGGVVTPSGAHPSHPPPLFHRGALGRGVPSAQAPLPTKMNVAVAPGGDAQGPHRAEATALPVAAGGRGGDPSRAVIDVRHLRP